MTFAKSKWSKKNNSEKRLFGKESSMVKGLVDLNLSSKNSKWSMMKLAVRKKVPVSIGLPKMKNPKINLLRKELELAIWLSNLTIIDQKTTVWWFKKDPYPKILSLRMMVMTYWCRWLCWIRVRAVSNQYKKRNNNKNENDCHHEEKICFIYI